jgi:hypothetical protein
MEASKVAELKELFDAITETSFWICRREGLADRHAVTFWVCEGWHEAGKLSRRMSGVDGQEKIERTTNRAAASG